MTKKQKRMLRRIIVASAMMIALAFAPLEGIWRFLCYLIPYLVIGYDILIKAAKGIWRRQLLDENFLMAIATVGAMAIGLIDSGDYVEAIAVMLFYQIGELFQSYAVGKSRRSIAALMDIRPDRACVERDGELCELDPDEVEIGMEILVRPGERVPIDGVVISGESSLDTSALTGESMPRSISAGDEIISGCINMTGVLKVRTTKPFGESTVSRILDLVENASSRKSRSENFITKFARVYTPLVCSAALALAVIPPIVIFSMGASPEWSVWIYRALSFLVASCPCALVVSIPLSFFSGLGGAGREGILIKGSNYLEALSKTDTVVLDKTGTLTRGSFEVAAIHHSTLDESELLYYVAHAESASSHPISRSLLCAYSGEIDTSRVSEVRETGGHGVEARVDGKTVAVGNERLMAALGVEIKPCHRAGTVVHVAIDGEYAGHIVIADTVKPTSARALAELKRAGVRTTVMLTGDEARIAEQTAGLLGIDRVYSKLLPEDKVNAVESLLGEKPRKATLVFVGDGINDAPVLSRADVGIAMGAMGSDAAIEAADVVLMDDDPMKIAKAIKISRKCLRIVYQNIVFAITVKLLALILVALGVAGMWMAVFADVGVAVLAILNATRALFVKKL